MTSLVIFSGKSQRQFDLVVHPVARGRRRRAALVTEAPHAVLVQRGDKHDRAALHAGQGPAWLELGQVKPETDEPARSEIPTEHGGYDRNVTTTSPGEAGFPSALLVGLLLLWSPEPIHRRSRPTPGLIRLDVTIGKSQVLNLQEPFTRVSVTNPAIADVFVVTPNQILVNGKAVGITSLVVVLPDARPSSSTSSSRPTWPS